MTQDQIDAANEFRLHRRMYASRVIREIEQLFQEERVTMSTRKKEEQDLLGSFLTVLEQGVKDRIKELI